MADEPKPHPTDPDPLPPVASGGAGATLQGIGSTADHAEPSAAGPTVPESAPAGARAISHTLPDALEMLDRTTVDDGAPSPADASPAKGDRTTMDDEVPADPNLATDTDTDDDDADEAPPPPPAQDAAKKRRRLWPFVLIGALLLVAISAPIAYILVFRYDPTAVKHIPSGTVIAFRIDAKELYLWKPFREHVVGKLDGSSEAKDRNAKLKKLTGIDLTSDLREIVIATPDGVRWVVLIGGYFHEARFSRSDVVKGLKTFLEEQGATDLSTKGGILYGPNGVEVTQAEDSTIIIANDHGLLQAALPESDEWQSLGLAGSGGASFVINETALSRFKGTASQMMLDPAMFGHSKRVSGFLKLGGKPTLSIEVVPKQVNVETLANEIEATLSNLRGLALLLLPDTYGMKRMLQNLKVKTRSEVVMLTAEWPLDGLEDAMKAAGAGVESFAAGKALMSFGLPSMSALPSAAPPDSASAASPEPTPSAPPTASSPETSTPSASAPKPTQAPQGPQPYVAPTATPTGI